MSELAVNDFAVLDYADELAHQLLGITEGDLTAGFDAGPESEVCRHLAAAARRRPGVLGLLVPSAARSGAQVLVIFPDGFEHVEVGDLRLLRLGLLDEQDSEDDEA